MYGARGSVLYRWGRGFRLGLLLTVTAGLPARAEAPPELKAVQGSIAADTTWDGDVRVEGVVTVEAGSVLTITPGTILSFRQGAALTVYGIFRAEGTAERPIVLQPADAGTPPSPGGGVTLAGSTAPSSLRHCRLRGVGAVTITTGKHRVADCAILASEQGIVVTGRESMPIIENNSLSDLAQFGIESSEGSQPVISGNHFERCGKVGILAFKDAVPLITGNTIADCDVGISLARTAPSIRGNTLLGNRRGIVMNLASGGRPIQENIVSGGEIGILCENFSSPVITNNTVVKNKDGIVCFQSSRPLVEANRIVENGTGLTAIQISNPTVRGNLIEDNDRGIYLDLSSYAVIHENDFDRNRLHIELGNMSSDWERRVGAKPARGRLQQTIGRLKEAGGTGPSAPAAAPGGPDGAQIMDSVDATNNWWGASTTREIEEKGADANISGIVDYHDVPTRTYEGFPGEYTQDRVTYAPWAKAPFAKSAPLPLGTEGRDSRK